MAYDIERLDWIGKDGKRTKRKPTPLSPREVAARNNGYNAGLYGNLPDGINEPTGDVETPGDQDESREFFGEATAIATENKNTLDADEEHPDGFKTVKVRYEGREFTIRRAEVWYMEEHPETPRATIEFPPMPIDYLGVTMSSSSRARPTHGNVSSKTILLVVASKTYRPNIEICNVHFRCMKPTSNIAFSLTQNSLIQRIKKISDG